MWDLKLFTVDLLLNIYSNSSFNFFFFISVIDTFSQKGFFLISSKIWFSFPQNMVFIFSLKFFLCIAFLILIRGGTPRYRYDYLTKLGWLKFLSLILLIFLLTLFFFFSF